MASAEHPPHKAASGAARGKKVSPTADTRGVSQSAEESSTQPNIQDLEDGEEMRRSVVAKEGELYQ